MDGTVVFEILSWWHAGTGRGGGPRSDAVVARTAQGLPYLPGRTVKGLLRNAVRLGVAAGVARPNQLEDWFGSDLVRGDPDDRVSKLEGEARFNTTTGVLRFESAMLGPEWAAWAAQNPRERERLFDTLASTSIDADGVARDETLRVIEASVPMVLEARVTGLTEESREVLEQVLPLFLRGLGSYRHRGLGRVHVHLKAGA